MENKEQICPTSNDLGTLPPDLGALASQPDFNPCQPSENLDAEPRYLDLDPQDPQNIVNLTTCLKPHTLAQDELLNDFLLGMP